MTITQPGIYPGISDLEYHADCCAEISISSSIAKMLIAESPAHAFDAHPRLGNRGETTEDDGDGTDPKKTKETEKGTLIHQLMLKGGAGIVECPFDSWRKDAAKAMRDVAKAKGEIPTLPHLLADARAAQQAARKQLDAMGYDYVYRDGMMEVTICWQEDGIWLRTKLDNLIINENTKMAEIHDLKTVGRSSHPEACRSQISKMGYDMRMAFYKRGLVAVRPDLAGRIKCSWDFMEVKRPYAVTPVTISAKWEMAADHKCEKAIALWRKCMTEYSWPFYTTKQMRLEPKPWDLLDAFLNDDES